MIAFIGIPATSASLFMVAGLLIGYLLWNRDRRGDQRALKIAENKAQQARQVARRRKQAFIELRERVEAGGGAGPPDATSPADHQTKDGETTDCETTGHDQTHHQTTDAETIREEDAATRREDVRALWECRQQIQQLGEIRDRLATANHDLTNQREDLAEQLQRSEATRQTVAAELKTTQQRLQTLHAKQAETAAAQLAAETTCGEQEGELERLQAACGAAEAAQQQAGEALVAKQEELREQTDRGGQLQQEFDRLQQRFENLQQRFEKTSQECADAQTINAQLQAALEEQASEFEELTQQLAGQEQLERNLRTAEGTIARLQGELVEAQQESRGLQSELKTLRPLPAQLQQRENDVARLENEVQRLHSEELEPLTVRHAQAAQALQAAEQETRQLVAERQQDREARNDLQGRTQQLETERHVLQRGNETLKRRLGELTAVVGQIRQELTETEGRSQEADAAYARTREECEEQAVQIRKLEQELAEAAAYREQVEVFEAKVRRLTESLRGVGQGPDDGPATLPFLAPATRDRAA